MSALHFDTALFGPGESSEVDELLEKLHAFADSYLVEDAYLRVISEFEDGKHGTADQFWRWAFIGNDSIVEKFWGKHVAYVMILCAIRKYESDLANESDEPPPDVKHEKLLRYDRLNALEDIMLDKLTNARVIARGMYAKFFEDV